MSRSLCIGGIEFKKKRRSRMGKISRGERSKAHPQLPHFGITVRKLNKTVSVRLPLPSINRNLTNHRRQLKVGTVPAHPKRVILLKTASTSVPHPSTSKEDFLVWHKRLRKPRTKYLTGPNSCLYHYSLTLNGMEKEKSQSPVNGERRDETFLERGSDRHKFEVFCDVYQNQWHHSGPPGRGVGEGVESRYLLASSVDGGRLVQVTSRRCSYGVQSRKEWFTGADGWQWYNESTGGFESSTNPLEASVQMEMESREAHTSPFREVIPDKQIREENPARLLSSVNVVSCSYRFRVVVVTAMESEIVRKATKPSSLCAVFPSKERNMLSSYSQSAPELEPISSRVLEYAKELGVGLEQIDSWTSQQYIDNIATLLEWKCLLNGVDSPGDHSWTEVAISVISSINPDFMDVMTLSYVYTMLLNPGEAMAIHLSLRVGPLDFQQGGNSRILYVHVPAARMSILVYIATAINTFLFLLTKHPLFLRSSGTGIEMGAFFTLFTLVTGGFRGRPMWGTFWVWDARLTSVFISFLIYLGALRFQKLPVEPASISIRAGPIDIPIIKSSVNWWNTSHQPGSISRSGTSIHVPMPIPILSNFANSPFSTRILFVLETRLPIPSFLESPLTEEIEAREGIPKPSSLAETDFEQKAFSNQGPRHKGPGTIQARPNRATTWDGNGSGHMHHLRKALQSSRLLEVACQPHLQNNAPHQMSFLGLGLHNNE
ncbi:hypothetical protein Ddye_012814 [Dipteronia dyeriana]|uniref:Cytochrome c assembly protein domain-containing protein n=1 Tax=Dipteronia dyeriana TaxID=168575 RepID=A0AAD9X5F9_9ROSI|nr:hypothetical protein Ddye_012814 [Dipteronia dyeriana]